MTATHAVTNRKLPGARVLQDGRVVYWWFELVAVVVYYAAYSAVRNHSDASPAHARTNALRIIDAEKWLHIYHEQPWNTWAARIKPLIIVCNYFYGSLHFVVTIGAAVFLYRRFTDDYPRWRNTLAVSTGLALIGFFTFPLMPPRLLPHSFGYIDTLAKDPTIWSFNSGAISKFSNQFAAMPSVHCAWALWCACVLVPRLRRPWSRALAAAYPAITVMVIVLTANHYVLDAAGGFAALAIGFAVAYIVTRSGRPPSPSSPLARPAKA